MDTYFQIADAIKKDVNSVIRNATACSNNKYACRNETGMFLYVDWNKVLEDIGNIVDHHLTGETRR